jgi:protein-S-isoprenylcysteine O-methyltransferase Ste14
VTVGKGRRDWTFFVVIGTIGAGAALAAAARHVNATKIADGNAAVTVGVSIALAGLALRTWAIVVLGRFFRVTVTIQPDHRVVDEGPYRLLRHPSYTGLLLILSGAGIALDNWLSLLALLLVPLAGILVRIRFEESALEAALGESYVTYEARTKRLIPGVW